MQVVLCGGFFRIFKIKDQVMFLGRMGKWSGFFFACQDEVLMGVLLVNRLWVR